MVAGEKAEVEEPGEPPEKPGEPKEEPGESPKGPGEPPEKPGEPQRNLLNVVWRNLENLLRALEDPQRNLRNP